MPIGWWWWKVISTLSRLWQYDIPYAVATLGTALTVDHVRVLSRYTKNIIALFDGDDAGQKAAARSFEIFVEAGLFGRAAFLPKGDDPDTFVRQPRQSGAWKPYSMRAVPLADYYFSWLEHRYGKSLEGKSQIAAEISRVLAKVNNPFEVDLLVRRAVDMLGIREEAAAAAGAIARRDARRSMRPGRRHADGGEPRRYRRALAGEFDAALASACCKSRSGRRSAPEWFGPKWRAVVDGIVAEWQEHGKVDVSRLTQELPPDQPAEIAALALTGERSVRRRMRQDGSRLLGAFAAQASQGRGARSAHRDPRRGRTKR